MKKKQEEAPKGSPAWMATFSDLMNLLLCFFVLLFSMSSVDESKVEAMIKSLQDTFSIFSGGGSSFEDGVLISGGISQISNLGDYFNTMGKTDDGSSTENVNDTDPGADEAGSEQQNAEFGENSDNPSHIGEESPDKPTTDKPNDGVAGDDKTDAADISNQISNQEIVDKAAELEKEQNKAESGIMYEDLLGLAEKLSLADLVEIAIDTETYQYIQIEISGAVLFDSGKDTVKAGAIPVLSKVGDMLKQYRNYKIEVIGHTDNTPTNVSKFANNDILSACRAISVAKYFAEDKGIGWDNLYYAGRGEHEPVADNSTAAGRQQNRRVEIRLYNASNSK